MAADVVGQETKMIKINDWLIRLGGQSGSHIMHESISIVWCREG